MSKKVNDGSLRGRGTGCETGEQSGAGPGEGKGKGNGNGYGHENGGPPDGKCAAQRFEKQVWNEIEGIFVMKRGIILRGPLVSRARMMTRQSVFQVRYDGGGTGEISLRPEERKSGTDRNKVPRGSSGSDVSARQPFGDEGGGTGNGQRNGIGDETGKRNRNGNQDENGSGTQKGERNGNEMGNENGRANGNNQDGFGSGTQKEERNGNGKPWQALEVGWCLERLCALYGASSDAFRTALRDYEASALPDGVRIEYKQRRSGSFLSFSFSCLFSLEKIACASIVAKH